MLVRKNIYLFIFKHLIHIRLNFVYFEIYFKNDVRDNNFKKYCTINQNVFF